MRRKVAVCLLSGGVDSTIAAMMKAQESGTTVLLLSIFYGQGAEESEKRQSATIADWLESHFPNVIEHFTMRISGEIRWTKRDRRRSGGFVGWRSPDGGYPQAGYPSTRDEVFALIAAAGAEAFLCDFETSSEAEIVLATTKDDLDNFADIEKDTYTTHLNAVLAKKLMPRIGKPMKVVLPLIGMTKAEIITKGVEIGAPLSLTWSCYFGKPGKPCGDCDQCKWRRAAFDAVGVTDPAA